MNSFGCVDPSSDSTYLTEETDWDAPWTSQCAEGDAMVGVRSWHSNHKEDRRWAVTCQDSATWRHSCKDWTDWKNDFDGRLNFKCGTNEYITGVKSYHDNRHEDRRFKIKCCELQSASVHSIKKSKYYNNWDQDADFLLGDPCDVIVGLESYHSNHKEDRRWKFEYGKRGGC